ncbi:unnamed protein product [Phaedon cochleariae]|uniref:Multidrug resistance-associated protein 4-like n=1 Tax=Phaedon cochleariae TaxID=80249 RepID=A0A9N9SCJ6_PHACE|nr:unnamed protein product [Phaedon cochleariae]
MDPTKEKHYPNPRDGANIFSILLFGYTIPIFKKGMHKTLDVEDLYNPLQGDRCTTLRKRLEKYWNKQLERTKENPKQSPSLLKALLWTFWIEILNLGLLIGISDIVIRITQPYVLGLLLDYYSPETTTSKTEALVYAGIIVSINLSTSFLKSQYLLSASHTGMRARAAVCSLIYKKALKLSQTAVAANPPGKLVNLLSNDVSRFDAASVLIHQIWIGPLSAIVILFLIFQEVGLSGTAGVVIIMGMLPLQGYVGKLTAGYRRKIAMKTDERVRLMDEVVGGIQVIKMYAWENPFAKLIALARLAEIKIIRWASYVRGIFMAISLFSNRFALFFTLVAMVISGQSITAAKVYVFMSYFAILAQTLSGVFVRGMTQIAELLVSIKRLQSFLVNEEFDFCEKIQMNGNTEKIEQKNSIVFEMVSAKWNMDINNPVLNSISLKIPKGKLIGITGPVGCGKSSLLHTILGELYINEGTMSVDGSVSYASQEPWIFSGTIRQNILFGSPYKKSRYNAVVRACALQRDFDQFPDADLTLIGDKGASLSGGQKARVGLARAVYKEKDIYLLDDPLSAVDVHVSKVLYDECINKFLVGKTRILVTHQLHCLGNADRIVILNNGRIVNEGTFSELAEDDDIFAQMLNEGCRTDDDEKENKNIQSEDRPDFKKSISHRSDVSSKDTEEENEQQKKARYIEFQEKTSKGTVSGSLLFKYFSSGMSWYQMFLVLSVLVFAQAAMNFIDWFISYWTAIEEYRNVTISDTESIKNIPTVDWSTETCLYIYGTGVAILFIGSLSRTIVFYKFIMQCCVNLHSMLFNGVIHAPMRFFETNPSGRILNRFSKDVGVIDEGMPRMLLETGRTLLQILGSIVLVLYVNPYSFILLFFLSGIFVFMRRIYLKSSKNIKRLEGRMSSPVFTHLMATLQGLTTVRAFKIQDILEEEFDKHQDYHTSAFYMFISTNSAFGLSLDLFSIVFIGVVTFSLIIFAEDLEMTGGQVGLAISQATLLCQRTQFAVRFTAEITNQLMSVERVLEYKGMEAEKQPLVPKVPSSSWPEKGFIEFQRVNFKYYEGGPVVLENVTFSIKECEKIGIVGRTGAGKSSLISAVLRLAQVEGTIKIDGIDTRDINLDELRSKISVIPQNPVLFSGTLRYNLDPFEEYTDEQLYRALEEVELRDPENIINRLENRVTDRGANYSVGQKQLICLARAILRNAKILLLDEATANVDRQ